MNAQDDDYEYYKGHEKFDNEVTPSRQLNPICDQPLMYSMPGLYIQALEMCYVIV